MLCTFKSTCGKETNVPVPIQLTLYQKFSPVALRIFFEGTKYEKDILPFLDAFVCPDCMPEWKAYVKRSDTALKAAKKRKGEEDYSI